MLNELVNLCANVNIDYQIYAKENDKKKSFSSKF